MSINRRQLAAINTLFSNASPLRKFMAALVLLAALAAWLWPQPGGGAQTGAQLQGTVVAIADGDTLTVLDAAQQQHKVRFAFIDAPEKAQPYGQRARQALSEQVFHQAVRVEVIEQDRYGRNVGRVWRQDQDINLLLVQQGYAWHYRQYAQKTQSGSDFARYEAAQQQAEHDRLGLWQQTTPQAPWDWRRNKREAG
ncbi:thermonuclease family protein [Vogesella sp. GCM10023246]|uniref:Thermonuclease family protein n=1 Tax=Vogesella oryzagri TaxID=3160864 RepID=A0ABV1M4F4_9NEIS